MSSLKLLVAREALKHVKDGMVLGLGSGSTAETFTRLLAERVAEESLDVIVIPTSLETERVALELGLEVSSINEYPEPDLAVDGADAVDRDLNLIKGGGACLGREKVIDYAAKEFIVIVDERKLVGNIFEKPVPVEVAPFAWRRVVKDLKRFGSARLRVSGGGKYGPVVTDNGNLILDLTVEADIEPSRLEIEVNSVPGVFENGVFAIRKPSKVLIGTREGVKILA